jgi:hypothetical protein
VLIQEFETTNVRIEKAAIQERRKSPATKSIATKERRFFAVRVYLPC